MYRLELKTLFINVGKQVTREAAEAAGVMWIVPARTMSDRVAGNATLTTLVAALRQLAPHIVHLAGQQWDRRGEGDAPREQQRGAGL